jgi:hypothetical protein
LPNKMKFCPTKRGVDSSSRKKEKKFFWGGSDATSLSYRNKIEKIERQNQIGHFTNYDLQTFNSDIIIDIKIINYNIPSISFTYYAGYTLARRELWADI